jgi:hypothetical protein
MKVHAGKEERGQPRRQDVGVEKRTVQIVEMLEIAPLAPEALRDPDAGDRFVEIAVDQRQPQTGSPVGIAHPHPPVVGQQHHQRRHRNSVISVNCQLRLNIAITIPTSMNTAIAPSR